MIATSEAYNSTQQRKEIRHRGRGEGYVAEGCEKKRTSRGGYQNPPRRQTQYHGMKVELFPPNYPNEALSTFVMGRLSVSVRAPTPREKSWHIRSDAGRFEGCVQGKGQIWRVHHDAGDNERVIQLRPRRGT